MKVCTNIVWSVTCYIPEPYGIVWVHIVWTNFWPLFSSGLPKSSSSLDIPKGDTPISPTSSATMDGSATTMIVETMSGACRISSIWWVQKHIITWERPSPLTSYVGISWIKCGCSICAKIPIRVTCLPLHNDSKTRKGEKYTKRMVNIHWLNILTKYSLVSTDPT